MAFFEVEEVEQVLKKVVELFLVPRFKELGMPATGEWEQNLEVVAESNSGKIRGRDYSQQLAFGRKPGKRPPVAPLQKWVMAKFGKGSKEALGIAYAISKKIENEDTIVNKIKERGFFTDCTNWQFAFLFFFIFLILQSNR